jgi:Asp-tRNA(Asn)/Glu-tRNA(Gln) amidotransferase A subunit family amidase
VGFDERGRPRSATFTGRLFDEGTLVRLGRAVESRLGVWDVRPEMFAG